MLLRQQADICSLVTRTVPWPPNGVAISEAQQSRVDINVAFPSLVRYALQTANMWEPFGTLPPNSTTYWKPAPTERGTFGILSTCILTLFLCVYTCLHPNVPAHRVTKWYQRPWALKVFGILVGLLAPELVSVVCIKWQRVSNCEIRWHFLLFGSGSGHGTWRSI